MNPRISPIRHPLAVAALALLLIGLPKAAHAQDEQKVDISATDLMKYDVTTLTGKVGQKLTITLTNKGTLPKAAMAHNLVILKPGTDTAAFLKAALASADNSYIPSELSADIIGLTNLLGPGESDTVSFIPKAAGTYHFLCTFPGHAPAGMQGVITIQ